jgi:hypothetical protein
MIFERATIMKNSVGCYQPGIYLLLLPICKQKFMNKGLFFCYLRCKRSEKPKKYPPKVRSKQLLHALSLYDGTEEHTVQ